MQALSQATRAFGAELTTLAANTANWTVRTAGPLGHQAIRWMNRSVASVGLSVLNCPLKAISSRTLALVGAVSLVASAVAVKKLWNKSVVHYKVAMRHYAEANYKMTACHAARSALFLAAAVGLVYFNLRGIVTPNARFSAVAAA